MRKLLNSAVILIILLVLSTSTVFAGTALELIEVRNDTGAPVFVFRVTGDFTKDELNTGLILVSGGENYILRCGQKSESTVTCQSTKKAAGHNVVIIFGNARFWTYAPLPFNCYSIWDWFNPPNANSWLNFGEHCQHQAATPGDTIDYYNEYSNTYETVTFFDVYSPVNGTCAVTGQPPTNEAGYYFPDCP